MQHSHPVLDTGMFSAQHGNPLVAVVVTFLGHDIMDPKLSHNDQKEKLTDIKGKQDNRVVNGAGAK